MNFQNIEFVKSAADIVGLPRDGLRHIVFAGRSNVGKSSVINCIAGRKSLARVSATPGKTAQINLYALDTKCYLVDLPGYGYAKVSAAERQRWGSLMEDYFARDNAFALGVLLVDARHQPTAEDVAMADYFKNSGLPFAVAANKTDKLKKSEIAESLERIQSTLELADNMPVISFSAKSGEGRQRLRDMIERCAKT